VLPADNSPRLNRAVTRWTNRHIQVAYGDASALVRENANACAWRAKQRGHPFAKAAYGELVRAWLILAVCAEELVRSRRPASTEERRLAA
jgi:hypothetical protein